MILTCNQSKLSIRPEKISSITRNIIRLISMKKKMTEQNKGLTENPQKNQIKKVENKEKLK